MKTKVRAQFFIRKSVPMANGKLPIYSRIKPSHLFNTRKRLKYKPCWGIIFGLEAILRPRLG